MLDCSTFIFLLKSKKYPEKDIPHGVHWWAIVFICLSLNLSQTTVLAKNYSRLLIFFVIVSSYSLLFCWKLYGSNINWSIRRDKNEINNTHTVMLNQFKDQIKQKWNCKTLEQKLKQRKVFMLSY